MISHGFMLAHTVARRFIHQLLIVLQEKASYSTVLSALLLNAPSAVQRY